MNIITVSTNNIIQAFSWMLIHSVWEGLLFAFIAGIILLSTKNSSSVVRHNLLLALFCAFTITAAFTFLYEYSAASQTDIHITGSNLQIQFSHQAVIVNHSPFYYFSVKSFITTLGGYFSKYALFIVALWFGFFITRLMVMAGSVFHVYRAKHYQVFAPPTDWQEKLASLCEKLQLKRTILLLESGYLKVPVVIGYFKPMILIPLGLIGGIPAEQIEAVLLHELAHIKRSDYLINILQCVIECVFFFNPGLLWVASLLREERENCCDDIAIAQTQNKKEYVQALISFKEYSISTPGYLVAFSGQKNSLLNRVMRLVYQKNKSLTIKEKGAFVAGIILFSAMTFLVYPLQNKSLVTKTIKAPITNLIKQPVQITGSAIADDNYTAKLRSTDVTYKKQKPLTDSITIENTKITDNAKPDNTASGQEMVKLVKKAHFEGDQFYSRIVLEGDVYDMIRVLMPSGSKMMATLNHASKVAFVIDGIIHEEAEIANFTPAQINSFDNGSSAIGPVPNNLKLYPDLDLSKYGAFVTLTTDQNSSMITQVNNISP